MDQFMTMRAFVETVKRRSLTNAAQALGTSRTLVSRQLQGLEDRLGVRLMHRTTRSISLTDAGEKYFHFCDDMLTRLIEVEEDITAEKEAAEGEISLLVPTWLVRCVTDASVDFARRHPAIRPRLVVGSLSSAAYDFLDQGCEVSFYIRRPPDSRIVARKIAQFQNLLCATPKYLENHPAIAAPSDLSEHGRLQHSDYPIWRLEHDGEVETVTAPVVLAADTYLVLHRAALADLGPVILPQILVKDDIAAGRLQVVLPDWETEATTIYLARAPGNDIPVKVRLFIDFMTDWFRTLAP